MSTGDFIGLWLHVLGFSVYAGATLALVAIVLPAVRTARDANARRAFLARALRVYDPLAIAALGVIVMTGAFNLTTYKDAMRSQFFARMGWLLTCKLALAFVVVLVGTYMTFGLGHRIVRDELAGEPAAPEWLQGMSLRLAWASVLVLALTALTAWLGLAIGHPR